MTNSTYTNLAKIIPIPGFPMVESFEPPRTPMHNCSVEKATRAYFLQCHRSTTPWSGSFSRFLSRLSVFTLALNPFNTFNSASQVFRFYKELKVSNHMHHMHKELHPFPTALPFLIPIVNQYITLVPVRVKYNSSSIFLKKPGLVDRCSLCIKRKVL